MKLELRNRGSRFTPPTSSETNPYPKGEHNGAEGPKYASILEFFVMSTNDTNIYDRVDISFFMLRHMYQNHSNLQEI